MNAIEDNDFQRSWRRLGQQLPRPRSILCISAHWEAGGVQLTGAGRPETIHDFSGFPRALFDVRYPAPGDPALAARVTTLITGAPVRVDPSRGLDHGAWSVLRSMYPAADVPVVQLGIDTRQPADWHYALAGALAPLREEGVLILGSGNIVHNLGMLDRGSQQGFDWAVRINASAVARISGGDHAALVDYGSLDPEIGLAVPTPEHYLPLLYALAVQRAGEAVEIFNDRTVMGAISMTSVAIGA